MIYRTSLAGLSLVCATVFVTPISAQPTACDLPALVRDYTLNNVPTAVLTRRIGDVHNFLTQSSDPLAISLVEPNFLPADPNENARLSKKGKSVVDNALSALDDFLGDVAATRTPGCLYCKLAPVYNTFVLAEYPNAIQADVQLAANASKGAQARLLHYAQQKADSAPGGQYPNQNLYSQSDTAFRSILQTSPAQGGIDADGRYNRDFLTYYRGVNATDPVNVAFYTNMKNTPPIGTVNTCGTDQTTKYYWTTPN